MFGRKKGKLHVLLVDNFEQVRDVALSILESKGYTVTAVGDVGEALKAIGKKMPDLILCEVELSGIGGIGFYHRLKKYQDTARIPFVFVTAYDHRKVEKEIQSQDLLIPKPVKWKEFSEQIEEFVQRRLGTPAEQQSAPVAAAPKTATPKAQPKKPAGKPAEPAHKAPSSRDTLQKTAQKTASQAAPQRLEIKPEEEKKKDKRKRRTPLAILPEGHATRNFSDPTAFFQFKQIKDIFASVVRAIKSGGAYQSQPADFPKSVFNWQEIVQGALRPRENSERVAVSRKRPNEEDLLDLEIIDSMEFPEREEVKVSPSEDEQIVSELMLEDVEIPEVHDASSAVEKTEATTVAEPATPQLAAQPATAEVVATTPGEAPLVSEQELPAAEPAETVVDTMLASWPAIAPDYEWRGKLQVAWHEKDQFSTTYEQPVDAEKLVDCCHTMFSMAGLCFQAFSEEFSIDYVVAGSENGLTFFVQQEEKQLFAMATGNEVRLAAKKQS